MAGQGSEARVCRPMFSQLWVPCNTNDQAMVGSEAYCRILSVLHLAQPLLLRLDSHLWQLVARQICPASRMANYALKPTVGLVSRAGVIPVSVEQDSPGPMGKCVRDVATLLNVIVGPDAKDKASIEAASHIDKDYTRFLTRTFDGLKFGVLSPWYFQAKGNIRDGDGAVEVWPWNMGRMDQA